MYYKNVSYSEKTFYGVTFKPGEIKQVPGYINDLHMIKVPEELVVKKVNTSDPVTANSPKKIDKKEEPKKPSGKDVTTENITQEEDTNG